MEGDIVIFEVVKNFDQEIKNKFPDQKILPIDCLTKKTQKVFSMAVTHDHFVLENLVHRHLSTNLIEHRIFIDYKDFRGDYWLKIISDETMAIMDLVHLFR